MTAHADLLARGYSVVSRRYQAVARIDRPDWRDVMAQDYAPWNLVEGVVWVASLGDRGAADHYRRVYSKDTLTVERINGLPNSSDGPCCYMEAQ